MDNVFTCSWFRSGRFKLYVSFLPNGYGSQCNLKCPTVEQSCLGSGLLIFLLVMMAVLATCRVTHKLLFGVLHGLQSWESLKLMLSSRLNVF